MSELTQYLVQSVPQLRASGAPKDNALDGVLVLAQEQLGEGADDLFGGGRESQVGFSTSAYDRVRQTLRNEKEQASLSGQGCDDDFQGQQGQDGQHVKHVHGQWHQKRRAPVRCGLRHVPC